MCGINGMVFLKGTKRTKHMLSQIKYVFSELMVETQARGHHATGIASFKRDGSYEFHKAPSTADFMTTFDSDYLNIVENINNETSAIVAHTRFYTQGKPENNDNNHPFEVGNIIGVHNGSVKNDHILFRDFKFDRVGEVDSEIIFHLIDKYNHEEITHKGLKEALEDSKIRGLFALAFVNKLDPLRVHLIKQERPLTIAYWKEAGVLIFNSLDDFIMQAFRKLRRVQYQFGIGMAEPTVEYKKIEEHDYYVLDANATTAKAAVSAPLKVKLETSTVKTYNHTGNGNTTVYNRNTSSFQSSSTTASTAGNTNTTSGGNNTTTNSNSTVKNDVVPIKTADRTGRIVEGELNSVTGEVTIFPLSNIAGVTDNEKQETIDYMNSLMNDEGDDLISCVECQTPLSEYEIRAKFNEGADGTHDLYCADCFEQALKKVLEIRDKVNTGAVV